MKISFSVSVLLCGFKGEIVSYQDIVYNCGDQNVVCTSFGCKNEKKASLISNMDRHQGLKGRSRSDFYTAVDDCEE